MVKMNRKNKNKPLTAEELQDILQHLSSDSENDYEDQNLQDEEDDNLLVETTSEMEDDIEIQSEQESDAELFEAETITELSGPQYTAKSGLEWSSHPFNKTKRLKRNILDRRPGTTQYSKSAKSILEVFNLFLTPEIKRMICIHTNEEASRYFDVWNEKNPTKIKNWKPLDLDELDCFLGVLVKGGALRCGREPTREMWTTDSSIRRSFFTAAMSRNRFEQLSVFLRFDDKTSRLQRQQQDKLAAISQIWDIFVQNCRRAFEPYESITIDEQLVCFRGKCPFRQFIKSKPARYGIKIWAAADVKTSYLCNLQVYTGKGPGAKAEVNQGFRVVSDLVQPFHGTGRGITTDNFFTSVPLANYLLTKNLTLLGTVRKNKTDTPPQLNIKNRPVESSIFAFTKDISMVSYIPKKNRMVHLLSSQHNDDQVFPEHNNKPQMIVDYNNTKGGVDNADKLIREYSCTRRTARWPYRLFLNIIDICALNAFVVFIENNPDWKKNSSSRRRSFLLQLGDDLARRNMKRRANYKYHHSDIRSALSDCGINMQPNDQTATLPQHRKRARCSVCPRKSDRKVNIICSKCKKYVCEDHRRKTETICCLKCLSN